MSASNAIAIAPRPPAPSMTPATVSVLTPDGFKAAMALAETLCQSGFLPRAIQRPAQALAVILAGQELGLPPMKSLREIHIIEGKPTLSAELLLSMFKRRGGHAKWTRSDDTGASLWLRHPNGDEHTETFTMEDAKRAGLVGKSNWRTYPKAMIRARCISAGLRAIGEADGIYDPDEMGAVTTPEGEVVVEAVVTPARDIKPANNTVVPPRTMSAVDEHGNVLATGEHFDAETGEVEPPAEPITPNQMKALGAALGELGVHTREGRLDWTTAIIRRKIATCKDLTKAEAGKAIEAARADIAKLDHEGGADDDGGMSGSDGEGVA